MPTNTISFPQRLAAAIGLIESAVIKLGPEGAADALKAFTEGGMGWHSCVIAQAYGSPGQLVQDANRLEEEQVAEAKEIGVMPTYLVSTHRFVAAAALGLTLPEVKAVQCAFDSTYRDDNYGGYFRECSSVSYGIDLRKFLERLLRIEAAKVPPVPAPQTIVVCQETVTKLVDGVTGEPLGGTVVNAISAPIEVNTVYGVAPTLH